MIKIDNIIFNGYSTENKQTELHFNLSVKVGEKVAIIGASGSGKSTLLNLISGFIYSNSGIITLDKKNHTLSKPFERPVSMLFQDNNLFNHLTIQENIGLGLQPRLNFSSTQITQIEQVAAQVGLFDYLTRKPDQLSGGQNQRVSLARCLLREQPILLLDEPFSALDKPLRIEMLALLENICQQKNLTLLLVTHQPEELSNFVDRTIEIGNENLDSA